MYFHYFVIISPKKKEGPFIWIIQYTLDPRMICAKFDWNWPSGSGEGFFKSSMHFCNFVTISSWKKAEPFIWTDLNHLHPRMPCAKFGWNWPSGSGKEDFYNLLVYFCNFVIISPLKRIGPSFKITRIPFILGYFVPSLVEIGPAVLEKKILKFVNVFL